MNVYEYQYYCTHCGKTFKRPSSPGDALWNIRCSNCGADAVHQFLGNFSMPPGIISRTTGKGKKFTGI